MSVSRRGDGRWLVKYKDAAGAWKQRSFKDEATARAFDAEMLPQTTDSRLSLGELVEAFYKARRDIHRETRQKVVYFLWGHYDAQGIFHRGRGLFLADKYAEELTRRDLQAMRDNMLKSGSSPATCNKMQAYLRAILAWGVEQELIRYNPWRDFKRMKHERPEVQVDFESFQRVYQHLPEYWQWAAQTAFFLYLRPGRVELFGLLWTAFDWRRGCVRVRQGKSGQVKTVYPHPEYMARAQERYHQDCAAGIVYVCHRGGKPVNSYRTAWEMACKRAGVKMRPYDIRHLAVTIMLERGADVVSVSAQLGHSTPSTTLNFYAHATEHNQRRTAELMPAIDLVQLGAGFDAKKG